MTRLMCVQPNVKITTLNLLDTFKGRFVVRAQQLQLINTEANARSIRQLLYKMFDFSVKTHLCYSDFMS